MTHFAEIDSNGIVIRVIVADQDFINSGKVGDPKNWIKTSYNTRGGIHKQGKTPLRKNYAGIGYTFDKIRNCFIPPKPYPSWILNEQTTNYESPTPMPKDGKNHRWNESTKTWEIFNLV